MDYRIELLMELNAWTSILKQQIIEISSTLISAGKLLFVISIIIIEHFSIAKLIRKLIYINILNLNLS